MPTTDLRGHTVPAASDIASRQSLLDLSLSIGDIKTCATQSAAQTYVNALKAAGVTINADNCVYVAVGGVLRVWNGTTWSDVAPPPASAWVSVPGQNGWNSTLKARKIGRIVEVRGYSQPSQRVGPNQYINVATIPVGYRPAAQLSLPASVYQGGATPSKRSAAIVQVDTTGTVSVMVTDYADSIDMNLMWGEA